MGSGQITKNLINLNLIEMIQFCLNIYDLWRHPTHWVCGWLCGSVGQLGSCQITKNLINLVIERHPHPCVCVWVVGWVSGSMGGVRSNDLISNKY